MCFSLISMIMKVKSLQGITEMNPSLKSIVVIIHFAEVDIHRLYKVEFNWAENEIEKFLLGNFMYGRCW